MSHSCYRCQDLTWDVEGWLLWDSRQRSVVVRSPDFQRLSLENDSVKRHRLRCLVHGTKLNRQSTAAAGRRKQDVFDDDENKLVIFNSVRITDIRCSSEIQTNLQFFLYFWMKWSACTFTNIFPKPRGKQSFCPGWSAQQVRDYSEPERVRPVSSERWRTQPLTPERKRDRDETLQNEHLNKIFLRDELYLCHSKRNISYIQTSSLSGHLTANNGNLRGCCRDARGGRRGQKSDGWNLTGSCGKMERETKKREAANH